MRTPSLPALCGLLCTLTLVACTQRPPIHEKAVYYNDQCGQTMDTDLAKAELFCRQSKEFSPHYADPYVNQGVIYMRQGQTEKARQEFIQALRLNQEQLFAWNNLGTIYLEEGSYGRAHDHFQRALEVDPDYLVARYNLARAYRGLKKDAEARRELRTLVAIDPNLSDPHYELGLIALERGALEEAVTELKEAARLAPSYAEAWQSLGLAYMEQAKFAEARDAFTFCLEADSEHIACRQNLALANRKALLLDPSLQEVAESGELDSAPALFTLAQQYRQRGLRNEEERQYRKCVRIDDRFAPCHYGLFLVYREERKDDAASIACKNFLKFALAEEFPREVESCERFLVNLAR